MPKVNKYILPEKWVMDIQLFWGVWFVCMMIFTKYGTSMSIIGFAVLGFYAVVTHFSLPAGEYFSKCFSVNNRSLGFLALTLVLWITVIGFFNSDNTQYWLSRVRIRLPFLALPVVFYWIPWNNRQKRIIVLTAMLMMFFSSTYVAVRYLLHYQEMNEMLGRGTPIPVPMSDHVRYAQLQAYIILSGVYWLLKDRSLHKMIKIIGWCSIVMMFFYIHLLAVRSGILVVYCGLLVFLVLNLKKISLPVLLVIVASFVATGFFSVQYIPSLAQKLSYMKWEYRQLQEGKTIESSDSGRWSSYDIGRKLYRSSPAFGIGPGDMDDLVKKMYAKYYPTEKNAKQPHNQFLHTLTGSGYIGLGIFLALWVAVLWFGFHYHNKILITMVFATFAAFMVESPLETARGTAIIAFWLSFWMAEGIPPDKLFRIQSA